MRSGAVLRRALKAARLTVFVVLGLIVAGKSSAEPSSATPKVIEALDNIRNLSRPGQDGYAAIWQGDKYIQCHALSDQSLSCEAAGAMTQPSLDRVLTPDRKQRLAGLGWRLDPSFGAYTQVFAPTLGLDKAADRILASLSQGYDADLTSIEVQIRWVAHQACPPRRGPGQNLAGLVDDDPRMAPTAMHGCVYSAPASVAANPPGTAPLLAAGQGSSAASGSEVVVVDVTAPDDAAADTVVLREPRARRERHPRSRSGRSRSTGTRHSRSGGHSSHRK